MESGLDSRSQVQRELLMADHRLPSMESGFGSRSQRVGRAVVPRDRVPSMESGLGSQSQALGGTSPRDVHTNPQWSPAWQPESERCRSRVRGGWTALNGVRPLTAGVSPRRPGRGDRDQQPSMESGLGSWSQGSRFPGPASWENTVLRERWLLSEVGGGVLGVSGAGLWVLTCTRAVGGMT